MSAASPGTRPPGVTNPGTYRRPVEKIPYLQELGITAVELLPIFEFDEFGDPVPTADRRAAAQLLGLQHRRFFAPQSRYAATGRFGMQVDEFKTWSRSCTRPASRSSSTWSSTTPREGNDNGPTICFRGLDNSMYYMMTPEALLLRLHRQRQHASTQPSRVRDFILDCLRFWVERVPRRRVPVRPRGDLGPRRTAGCRWTTRRCWRPSAHDPVLRDASSSPSRGTRPASTRSAASPTPPGRSGTASSATPCASSSRATTACSANSPPAWSARPTCTSTAARGRASINFVTCHDGFTLADLVSYNDKHNEANGEDNRDGANDNNSWNCGVEGPTDDPEINAPAGQADPQRPAVAALSRACR